MSKAEAVGVSGLELNAAVDKILAIMEGLNPTVVYVACVAVGLMTQNQDLSKEQMKDAIFETTNFISGYLDSLSTPASQDPVKES